MLIDLEVQVSSISSQFCEMHDLCRVHPLGRLLELEGNRRLCHPIPRICGS